ncbi:SPOR domain-containing protein [Pseudoalteromonas sp.]|uniref:SPOR domain-containing protein n=1 Tax=Pseudoalteromonas sp. TaxID=53249 RepID=UPI003566DEA0
MQLKRNFKRIVIMLTIALLVSACSAKNTHRSTTSDPVKNIHINKAELAQLQHSAEQWQNAQPKVEKLLELESKLAQLSVNLKQIEQQKAANTQQVETIFNLTELPAKPVTLFALQVAAFKDKQTTLNALTQLKQQAPDIITATLVVNIEPAIVQNTRFYRLKLGAYKTKSEALEACQALMQQQINCFVSNYTADKT